MYPIRAFQYHTLSIIDYIFFITSSTSVLIRNEKKLNTLSQYLYKIDRESFLNKRLILTNTRIKDLDKIHLIKRVTISIVILFFLVGAFIKFTQTSIPEIGYLPLFILAWISSVIYGFFFIVDYADAKINLLNYKKHILAQLNNKPDKQESHQIKTTPLNLFLSNIKIYNSKTFRTSPKSDNNIKSTQKTINDEPKEQIPPLNLAVEAKVPAILFHFLIENNLIKLKENKITNTKELYIKAEFFSNYHFLKSNNEPFGKNSIGNQFRLLQKNNGKVSNYYCDFTTYLKKYENAEYKFSTPSGNDKPISIKKSESLIKALKDTFEFEISDELVKLISALNFEFHSTTKNEDKDPKLLKLTKTEYSQITGLIRDCKL